MSTEALFDELHKIAVATQEQDLKREKMIRSLKAGLASAGGLGLGYGLGNLAADTIIPQTLARHFPRPTAGQLSKGMLLAGGVGALGSLLHGALRKDVRRYTEGADQMKQDFSMGHEKLNPEHYGGAR